jgi:hypothetical protein
VRRRGGEGRADGGEGKAEGDAERGWPQRAAEEGERRRPGVAVAEGVPSVRARGSRSGGAAEEGGAEWVAAAAGRGLRARGEPATGRVRVGERRGGG